MKKKWVAWVLAVLLLLLPGCTIQINSDGNDWKSRLTIIDTKRENNTLPLEGIKRANVNLNVGVIKTLNLEGGAPSDKLMDSEFVYNVKEWKPIVNFNKNNDEGKLSIDQPSTKNSSISSNIKYEWNLKFNSNTLLDIDADMGVGKSSFDLSKVNLEKLKLQLGVGESTIDMSGNYSHDVDVDIDGGVGSTTIYVPRNMNCTVDFDAGVGKISIDGFSKDGSRYTYESSSAKNTIKMDVHAGVGSIKVKLKDSEANTSTNVKAASANCTIDQFADAVLSNNTELIDAVLKSKSIDINQKNSEGKYPLEMALVLGGNCEMAQTLLEAGANPKVVVANGKTIYETVMAGNNKTLKAIFSEYE